jgi:SAM-dependent methyltransferase
MGKHGAAPGRALMTAWDEQRIREFLGKSTLRKYQRIDLGHGLSTPGKDRTPSADAIFRQAPEGKNLLDVGCDYGYFCHEAVRRGAASATGLEMNPENFAIAQTIAEIKGGPVSIVHGSLEDTSLEGPFEWVLLLNVIHHAKDPFNMMQRLAQLATERVVVEFPTPAETRFLKTSGLSRFRPRRYNDLPFIGIGPDPYHEAYYFTPRAFELAFSCHLPLFRRIRFEPSPSFPERVIAFCEK